MFYKEENKPLESLTAFLDALEVCSAQDYFHVYRSIYELLSGNRGFDFEDKLDQLRSHLEKELKTGSRNPQLVGGLWLMIELSLRKSDLTDVFSGMETLVAGSAGDNGTAARAYAEDVAWALKEIGTRGALRLNCGGDAYTDPEGLTWARDRFFFSGRVPAVRQNASEAVISATNADALFYTAREFPYGEKAGEQTIQGYWIPVIPGDYTITLFFAEPFSTDWEPRAFTVAAGGKEVVPRYDTRSQGAATADFRTFPVRDGGAIVDITFMPERVGAFVCAIEVRKVPAVETGK